MTAATLLRRHANEAAHLARLQEEIADIEAAMREVPCPDDLAKGVTLYQHYRGLPAAQEPFLTARAETIVKLTASLYTRLVSDLITMAEQTVDDLSAQPTQPA